jgi:hypothetical protein
MRRLTDSWAMLVPAPKGRVPVFSFAVDAATNTELTTELRASSKAGNYTPDKVLAMRKFALKAGRGQDVTCDFGVSLDASQYVFVTLRENPAVSVALSGQRLSGILAVHYPAKGRMQQPPEGSGIESFEFWTPARRPGGENLAMRVNPALDGFRAESVINGVARPTTQANAWVADPDDPRPSLKLAWTSPHSIREIVLGFDTDFDHPMESVLYGHPEAEMPFCVKRYRILDDQGRVLHEASANHQTRNTIRLARAATTRELRIEIEETHGAPAALFEVRCYA